MRIINTILSFVLAMGVLSAASILNGQAPNSQLAPEVNTIRIFFKGFQSVSEEYVLGQIQLRPGMDYDPVVVDQSIKALYNTNQFEFVEVKVEDTKGDKVDVTFQVVPRYTIGKVEFEGNDKYSDTRLANKGEIESDVPLDEYAVSLAAEKIEAYYIDRAHPDISVDYRINRDSETGYATILFDIDEGSEVEIAEIDFVGNEVYEDKKLRKILRETKKSSRLSWLTGGGKFDEAKFREDLELLREFYRNHGYLDVVIKEDDIQIAFKDKDEEKRIRLTIPVIEGRQYALGELSIENSTIFTVNELLSILKEEPGEPFDSEKIDKAVMSLTDYYTARGYLNVNIRAVRVPNMETSRIDVSFRIRETQRFYIESIKVEGNTKTKTRVIIRELALRPGDTFDLTRMKTSETRLKNTRYFENVTLNDETTNIPGRKNLNVTVTEGPTGNFSFGAGFSSVENMVVFLKLTQGNFDLFNWRNGFQGDGQKFRLRTSLGKSSNEVVIAFEEPWLFEQRLALGTELFRRESEFNSTDYDERRTGFEVYLRRRLFELVEARFSYSFEFVDIFDVMGEPGVDDDEVADVFEEAEGKEAISKFSLTFLRDDRDSIFFTRKGSRTTIVNELAGLGGDVSYYKIDTRMAHFIPTFDTLEQSFSIVGRIGMIVPYGSSEKVPFYDRFYLGGPDSLRGFDYRDIGPRDEDDADESVGGNTYGLLSLEYVFRLAEPLGLAVFYDLGFVNEDDYDFSFSDYADNLGIGARIMILGSPLNINLAVPITDPTGKGGRTQTNFSFGTRF